MVPSSPRLRPSYWLVFRYNTKDYCIQQPKPQLAANLPKSPQPADKFQHWSVHITEFTWNFFSHTSEHISCTIKIYAQIKYIYLKIVPFHEQPSSHYICGTTLAEILQIHTQILSIQISSSGHNFSKYSHIQKYRTNDHDAGGRPIGSLTTIHTIPAIPITLLAMRLWSVIRVLYVYACRMLSGYMTKLLVMYLEQLRSPQYKSMLKIMIPENCTEKPPSPILPFCEQPGSHYTCGTTLAHILQIHTQIPRIWISSSGHQLCQLFKVLTYTEVQDKGSWCRRKAYRKPHYNTH